MVEVDQTLYRGVAQALNNAYAHGDYPELSTYSDTELATDVLAYSSLMEDHDLHYIDDLPKVTACVHEWRETQKTFVVQDERR